MSRNDTIEIQKSITRNTSVMMGAQVITWASSFILLLFLPRYLGSDAYGKLFLAMSISMMIEVLIDFGGGYLIPKEVSRDRSKTAQILSNFGVVRSFIWMISMIGLVIFAYMADYPQVTVMLIVIFGFSRLWMGAKRVLTSGFQGHERMEYPSLGNIAERVFVSAVVVGVLLMGAGPIAVAIIMAIGVLINLLVLLMFSPKIVSIFPKVEWGETRTMIQVSLPYFLWSLFSIIYYRVDAIMLSLITSDDVVGWYGASYRFFDIVMVFPSIFTAVIFPIFARLWVEEKNQMLITFRKSLKFLIILGVPIALGIFYYSSNIVDLFFGLEEYTPSVLVLQLFALSIVLVYVDFILGSTIMAADKQKKWAVIGFVAIFVNVILNYICIPLAQQHFGNGGLGAAFSTFVTEAYILVSALLLLPREYVRSLRLSYMPNLIFAGVIMYLVMWGGSIINIPWFLSGFFAGVIFLLSVTFLGVLDTQEKQFVLERLSLNRIKKLVKKRSETTV